MGNDVTEEFKKKVGAYIKGRRNKLNRTQEEVASEVGTHVETVRRWELGISFPNPKYRRKLIKLLHLRADTFHFPVEQLQHEKASEEKFLPFPIQRTYKGWRTGNYKPFVPGHRPDYDSEVPDDGAGETHVTINGYPLVLFEINHIPYGHYYDWGYIGPAAENLAASLLADYFGERLGGGEQITPEKYLTVQYYFQFYVKVVLYLPYEEWEFSSTQIADWLNSQRAKEDRKT